MGHKGIPGPGEATHAKGWDPALRTDALYRMSRGLAGSLELQPLVQLALEEALKAANIDAGIIRFLDDSAGELVLLASHGLPPELDAGMRKEVGRVPLGRGLAGEAAKSGKPLAVEDLETDERCLMPGLARFGYRSAAYVPLRAKGKVLGIISGYTKQRRVFGAEDLEALDALGTMVGMAIANARLFEQVETAKQEWEKTFDAMSEGVAIVSPDGHVLRANKAMAKMLGLSLDALLGQECHKLVHGLDNPDPAFPKCSCQVTKRPYEAVWREPNLGGRWIRLKADPILSPEGNVVAIVQTFADVTREKGREAALARLHDLSKMLSTTLNLNDATRLALEEVGRTFGTPGSTLGIAMLDESGRELKIEAVLGPLRNQLEGVSLPVDRLLREGTHVVFQERRPWLQRNVSQSSQVLKDLPGFLHHECFVAVPMVSGDRVIGVLFMASKESKLPEEEELGLLV